MLIVCVSAPTECVVGWVLISTRETSSNSELPWHVSGPVFASWWVMMVVRVVLHYWPRLPVVHNRRAMR